MNVHENARLTPTGRDLLAQRVDGGWTVRKAASDRGSAWHGAFDGGAERFIQTSLREWAYASTFASSNERAKIVQPWLDAYNRKRPHSAIGHITPWQRLNNLLGNDT